MCSSLSRSTDRLASPQDLYNQPISKLVDFIVAANKENPNIAIEVFVHKAEKLQEDDKIGMGFTYYPTSHDI